ncbi:hypothetical protein C8Q70DRAFT_345755 [Cubamyces menziesii]|nr:hypothetical protein C8Q70DRAFT_345755 [Cubamyces menziesii]
MSFHPRSLSKPQACPQRETGNLKVNGRTDVAQRDVCGPVSSSSCSVRFGHSHRPVDDRGVPGTDSQSCRKSPIQKKERRKPGRGRGAIRHSPSSKPESRARGSGAARARGARCGATATVPTKNACKAKTPPAATQTTAQEKKKRGGERGRYKKEAGERRDCAREISSPRTAMHVTVRARRGRRGARAHRSRSLTLTLPARCGWLTHPSYGIGGGTPASLPTRRMDARTVHTHAPRRLACVGGGGGGGGVRSPVQCAWVDPAQKGRHVALSQGGGREARRSPFRRTPRALCGSRRSREAGGRDSWMLRGKTCTSAEGTARTNREMQGRPLCGEH